MSTSTGVALLVLGATRWAKYLEAQEEVRAARRWMLTHLAPKNRSQPGLIFGMVLWF